MTEDRRAQIWRRTFLVWLVIFTFLVFFAIRSTRQTSDRLQADKASIASLQKTNCALKSFLITAAKARKAVATDKKASTTDRRVARQAYQGYIKLADLFSNDGCGAALVP